MAQEVSRDLRLSKEARLVYVELCNWCRPGVAEVKCGQRWIAKATGISQEKVGLCLKELASLGHIVIISAGDKRRGRYRVTADALRVVGESDGEQVEFDISDGSLRRRLVKTRDDIVSRPATRAKTGT